MSDQSSASSDAIMADHYGGHPADADPPARQCCGQPHRTAPRLLDARANGKQQRYKGVCNFL